MAARHPPAYYSSGGLKEGRPYQQNGMASGRGTHMGQGRCGCASINGYVPTGGLHGVFLHGSRQQYEGFDYRARRVRMELFSKWAVNQHDELEEIIPPEEMR